MHAIPKYSLSIASTVPASELHNRNDLHIMNRSIEPNGAALDSSLQELISRIAEDYFVHKRGEFNPTTARIAFSPEGEVEILTSSNPEMNAFFTREKQTYETVIAEALEKVNLTEPLHVDLEISEFKPLVEGAGLTTGYLRFPHMLTDMHIRFSSKLTDPNTKIGIVGPGAIKVKDGSVTCPQFTELAALFPHAHFTLLDNDKKMLGDLQKAFRPGLYYDPLMLRFYTMPIPINPLINAPVYQKMLATLKGSFAAKATIDVRTMLSNVGELRPFHVKFPGKQVKLCVFDINTDKPRDQFDIIVATFSIVNAIVSQKKENGLSHNYIQTLFKFAEQLKEGGSLYVDAALMVQLQIIYGEEAFKLIPSYFEALLGNKLSAEEIPLSNVVPTQTGFHGTLPSGTIEVPQAQVTSANIVVFSRREERTSMTEEERRTIIGKMEEIAKARAFQST